MSVEMPRVMGKGVTCGETEGEAEEAENGESVGSLAMLPNRSRVGLHPLAGVADIMQRQSKRRWSGQGKD